MADLPCVAVAPISLAYSGSICATVPVPRVARCHAIMNVAKIKMETNAARSVSERVMALFLRGCPAASSRPLDGEALDVVLGLGRIESLAHDRKALRRGRR